MESRRDQFQLLEHFTLAIKDDSARPQIAQLTELGLVELTRKRQGQNIYELFGEKFKNSNGSVHLENLLNHQNSNLEIDHSLKKSSKLNNTKLKELEPIQVIEKQEKIIEKDIPNTKNLDKEDDHSFNKENDKEIINTTNPKEKKVITVELNNNEKFVYSQLGINPLIKLGKEYLTSNNQVRLENDDEKKDNVLKENKSKNKVSSAKPNKKNSSSNTNEEVKLNDSIKVDSDINLPKITNENEEIELTDEIDNSRRKRRRSSASIE